MTDVFLHVGLAKTGTTTIQAALEQSAARLAAEGVLFPGSHHRAQRLAAYDLLGQRVRGEEGERVACGARTVPHPARASRSGGATTPVGLSTRGRRPFPSTASGWSPFLGRAPVPARCWSASVSTSTSGPRSAHCRLRTGP